MGILQTHAAAIFLVIVFILRRFRHSTLIYVCVFALIHFQEPFQIKNAQCTSVDGRPKHIEMCAFSSENALVWMRP